MGTRSGAWLAHSWFNSYAPELVPIFIYRDKTRVHMFYFLILRVTLVIYGVQSYFKTQTGIIMVTVVNYATSTIFL